MTSTPQLRLYMTNGEYFICSSVSLFIKRYNSMLVDVDIEHTIKALRVARNKYLSLKYNSEMNTFLFDTLKLSFR